MNTQSRIASILKTQSLDASITGIPSFDLSVLDLASNLDFALPTNLRLGHLAEKVVAECIKSSVNYCLLYENIQVVEGKRTVGELDFIVEEINTKQLTHMELAYKLYLYDPSISSDQINNWIGPNRNDSLKDKLAKLKRKQFPLLYHNCAQSSLENIAVEETKQALCLLVSLFVPYQHNARLKPAFEQAIKGYYLNFETFASLDHSAKTYYLPPKSAWGIDPSENETWLRFNDMEETISISLQDKQAPLCWQKDQDSYSEFFIVWW